MVLLLEIFVRNNVLAVAYLPILGLEFGFFFFLFADQALGMSLLLSDRNLKSAFLFLSVFFGALLVIQYVALFDFPPISRMQSFEFFS